MSFNPHLQIPAVSIAESTIRLVDAIKSLADKKVLNIPPTGYSLEQIQRDALTQALEMKNWVQKDAAELLGISPRVMNYQMKILGVVIPEGYNRGLAMRLRAERNSRIA